MAYELEWTRYSRDGYRSLDGSRRVVVDKGLARIKERGMQAGEPLSGDLAGCNKIKHRKLGLRIVFRPSTAGIEIIEVVIIGKREGDRVYRDAAERLRDA